MESTPKVYRAPYFGGTHEEFIERQRKLDEEMKQLALLKMLSDRIEKLEELANISHLP